MVTFCHVAIVKSLVSISLCTKSAGAVIVEQPARNSRVINTFHAGKVLSPAIYDLLRSIKKIEPQEDWLTKHYRQIQKTIDNNESINLIEV